MNIILIGMPACGKSTLGVLLAKAMGRNFIDTDLLIQEREGILLQEIIDKFGSEKFLNIEEEVLCSVQETDTIIATGGSAIYSEKAMNHLGSGGKIIYLKLTPEEIENRLDNIKARGIAMEKGETVRDLYNKRVNLYEKYADIVVALDGLNTEECVQKIMQNVSSDK